MSEQVFLFNADRERENAFLRSAQRERDRAHNSLQRAERVRVFLCNAQRDRFSLKCADREFIALERAERVVRDPIRVTHANFFKCYIKTDTMCEFLENTMKKILGTQIFWLEKG